MKKNMIALLLCIVMTAGSFSGTPVLAAETTAEEAVAVEEETVEEETEIPEEADTAESAEGIEEDPSQDATELVEEAEITEETEVIEEAKEEESADIADTSSEAEEVEDPAVDAEEVETEDEVKDAALENVEDIVDSGTCGENAIWTLTGTDEELTLTISGSGEMYDYTYNSNAPWENNKERIITVAIDEGITRIGNESFLECSNLVNISIPSSLTSIGNSAFTYCSKLESVSIPNNTLSIGDSAFLNCSNLRSIDISDNLVSIGQGTFYGCSALTSIVIPDGVERIDNSTFTSCTSLESVKLPVGLDYIGQFAFHGCSALTSIAIPEGVKSIEWRTFTGCSSLERIDLPTNIESIGKDAFSYCSNLKNIKLPNKIKTIGKDAFYECDSITNISIPGSVLRIEIDTFHGCDSLSEVTLGEGIESIEFGAFYGCPSLIEINIPDSVANIGEDVMFSDLGPNSPITGVFEECTGLKKVFLGKNLKTLGYRSFYNCRSLIDIQIPDNVGIIGESAFSGCTSLIDIVMGNNIGTIRNCAFRYCENLKNVVLPENITIIGGSLFEDCSKLNNISIPDSVTLIGGDAFSGCSSLTEITIPKGVTEIYEGTFSLCTSLKEVTIPSGVISIDGNTSGWGESGSTFKGGAFSGCVSLTNVILPDSLTEIGYRAFSDCTSLKSIDIPNSVTAIRDGAFLRCTELKSVSFGEGLQVLGTEYITNGTEGVFKDCKKLSEIELPSKLEIIGTETFQNCGHTKCVAIPEGVKSIGNNAFFGSDIECVYVPNSVTYINGEAFSEPTIVYAFPDSYTSGYEYYDVQIISDCVNSNKYIDFISETITVIPGDVIKLNDYLLTNYDLSELDIQISDENLFIYDNGELSCINTGECDLTVISDSSIVTTKLIAQETAPQKPDRINLKKHSLDMVKGDSAVNEISLSPENSDIDSILWKSSNDSVVTVNNGIITAIGEGTATVTAYSGEVPDVYDECIVNVSSGELKIILPESTIRIERGKSRKYAYYKYPNDMEADVSFRSKDISIAEVDQNGIITAKKAGQTEIEISAANVKRTVELIVFVPTVEISFIERTIQLLVGDTTKLDLVFNPEDATERNVIWNTNNATVATVDGDGLITGQGRGIATITAIVGDAVASVKVTVLKGTPAYIVPDGLTAKCGQVLSDVDLPDGFTWTDGSQSVGKAGTKTFKAYYTPEDQDKYNIVNDIDIAILVTHSFNDWIITKDSTCLEDGSKERTCINCGDKVTEVIESTGHTWNKEYTVDKEATCTEEGSESIHCSVCGVSDENTVRTIPATGHTYGDWTVTKEATCTEDGSREKVCTGCGDTITEAIPANGHVWNHEYTVDKESTCTKEGSESVHCSICDEIDETTVRSIEKKEHAYSDWVITKEASCTEDGSKEKVCADCGEKTTEVISAHGHTWNAEYTIDKEATCTEEGTESIHCSVCNEIDESTVRAVEKKDHAYGDWVVTKEATCTEDGSKEKVCDNCADKVIETIPAKGHTWNAEYTTDKESTYTEEGAESIHCSVCGEIKEGTQRPIAKMLKPVSMLTISGITAKTYNGKAQTQTVIVKDGDLTLEDGPDYTVSYKDNTNAGTASVVIKGEGNYTGEVIKTFTIKKAPNTITAKSFTRTYSTKAQTFDLGVKIKNGTPTYTSNSKSVTVSKAGKVTVKAKFIGKATITITAPEKTNYSKQTKKITITVNPTKTALSSVTSPSAGKMTVKWKKNAVGTGYQIQYSTSSKFTNPKYTTVNKNTTLSKTIGGLAKGKKYYVRIRTKKIVGKLKFFSSWSAVKTVTIKK